MGGISFVGGGGFKRNHGMPPPIEKPYIYVERERERERVGKIRELPNHKLHKY